MVCHSPRPHVGDTLLCLAAASAWTQCDLQLQSTRLLGLLFVERLAVHIGHVRLVLDFVAEGANELLGGTFSLLAEKVLLPKVIRQIGVLIVELVAAIGITEVAKVVLASQMSEKLITVYIALLAVFAQGMATVRTVVRIAFGVVQLQL